MLPVAPYQILLSIYITIHEFLSFKIRQVAISGNSWSEVSNKNESRICVLCSHVLWTRIQNLTWWCNNPWDYDGNHSWGAEDHAPRQAPKSGRSNRAQTSQSRAASRLFNHGDGGCPDTGRNRAARGWSTNNRHLQKKRSGSFKKTWCSCSGIFSPEYSLKLHNNF